MIDSSYIASIGEANARLLFEIAKENNADGLGAISNFFGTHEDFCCPCCHRSKRNIARIDKNGHLLCQFVYHHDHFGDTSGGIIKAHRGELDWRESRELHSLGDNFERFPQTLICSDCNVAEGAAKKVSPAIPPAFSFTPLEISQFIIVSDNKPHRIDGAKVIEIFEALLGSLQLYGNSLRSIRDYRPDSDFEQIGGAAWRVLRDVNNRRKKKDGSQSNEA